MASMKQVSLSLFLMLTQTPGWLSRRLTTSVWPEPAAYIRGTQPRQFRVLTSIPWSRSLRTVARSPLSEAPHTPRAPSTSVLAPSRNSLSKFVGVVTDSVRDRPEDIAMLCVGVGMFKCPVPSFHNQRSLSASCPLLIPEVS